MTIMEAYAAQFEKARRETLEVAASVPETARLAQIKAGTATPLWLLGHLSMAMNGVIYRYVLGGKGPLTGEQMKPYSPSFVGGAPPTANPADYDTWDELIRRYDGIMRECAEMVAALDPEVLNEPTPDRAPQIFRERFPTKRDCLHQMISHDAYHRGQLSLLAKHAW